MRDNRIHRGFGRVAFAVLLLAGCNSAAPVDPALATSTQAVEADADGGTPDGAYAGHLLTDARLVRRIQLSLLGRSPTDAEYQAMADAKSDDARQVVLAQMIDQDLGSLEFYRSILSWGHDYLPVGGYNIGVSESYYDGSQAIDLSPCAAGTLHAGKLGVFSASLASGDPKALCASAAARVDTVEPWWAPGTQVQTIGRAGSGLRVNGTRNCGASANLQGRIVTFGDDPANPVCSCGPNLIYCWASPDPKVLLPLVYHQNQYLADSQRRQLWEEPARLLAHLAWYDRPLSDLVVGNYTVATRNIRYMYVRAGRMNPANSAIDDVRWWDPAQWSGPSDSEHGSPQDPLAWTEVVPETLDANLLSLTPGNSLASGDAALQRSYPFDPRTQAGEPKGIPFAGVLTVPGSLGGFPRERVRAARWLETFACRSFVPPPPTQMFNPYQRDPATEGVCQHCHSVIDPAAIHFKRWGFGLTGSIVLGGLGPWRAGTSGGLPFSRWQKAYLNDTVLTPVSVAQLHDNPDAVFMDFLPSDRKLFGATSDGTIGPLGFGKLLVQSGEFDQCAVRKIFQRFVGTPLEPDTQQPIIDELTEKFVAEGRKLRPFLRALLVRPEMRRGW